MNYEILFFNKQNELIAQHEMQGVTATMGELTQHLKSFMKIFVRNATHFKINKKGYFTDIA